MFSNKLSCRYIKVCWVVSLLLVKEAQLPCSLTRQSLTTHSQLLIHIGHIPTERLDRESIVILNVWSCKHWLKGHKQTIMSALINKDNTNNILWDAVTGQLMTVWRQTNSLMGIIMNIIDRNKNTLSTRCHLTLTLYINGPHCWIKTITVDYIQAQLTTWEQSERIQNTKRSSPSGVNLPP